MKLPCFIVQDLLPLYAENLLRQESVTAVKDHLEHCPGCRSALEETNAPIPTPEVSFAPVTVLKKELNRRRSLSVLLAVTLVLALAVSLFAHLTSPRYISFAQCGVEVYTDNSGKLYGELPAHGTQYHLTEFSGEPGTNHLYLSIEMWNTRLCPREETRTILLAEDSTRYQGVFYTDYTQNGVNHLLWGSTHGGSQLLPRLTLSYYALLAALAAGILGIACLVLWKKKEIFSVLLKLLFVPLSYLGGQLLAFGSQTVHAQAGRALLYILLTGGCLYVALLTLRRLADISRGDGA